MDNRITGQRKPSLKFVAILKAKLHNLPKIHRWKVLVGHLVLLALALCIRVHLVQEAKWVPRSDTRDYHEIAANLLAGKGMVIYYHENPTLKGLVHKAGRPPGYPLVLAGIYKVFGFNPLYAYYVNVLAEMGIMLLVMCICYHYFDATTALLAQVIFGINVIWTPNLMTESIFAFFFTAAILIIQKNPRFDRWGLNLLLGVVVALSVTMRPVGIFIGIPCGVLVLLNFRWRHLWRYSLVGLPLAIYLCVWLTRNYNLFGCLLMGSNFGPHLSGAYGIDKVAEYVALRQELARIPTEVEWSDRLLGLVKTCITESPMTFFSVYGKNFITLFSLKPVWQLSYLWMVTFQENPGLRLFIGWCTFSYMSCILSP